MPRRQPLYLPPRFADFDALKLPRRFVMLPPLLLRR